jgi:hypothetical protein
LPQLLEHVGFRRRERLAHLIGATARAVAAALAAADSEPCRGCSIKRIRSIHDHGRYNGESCYPACPDDGRT